MRQITDRIPKLRAIAALETLRSDVIERPHLYDYPDHGLGTRLAVYSYALGQGQTITNDQTVGVALCQLINRLLEEV